MRHAADNISEQQPTCIAHRQHAPDFQQHAADNNDMQRNMERAACKGQSAACNMQRESLEKAIANRQQGNMRHAADIAQKTANPGNACNRPRATASRRHARAREHMRHHRLSCATSSAQRTSSSMREALYSTTSAQHGTDATQAATYDRCHSTQQTHAEPEPRSR